MEIYRKIQSAEDSAPTDKKYNRLAELSDEKRKTLLGYDRSLITTDEGFAIDLEDITVMKEGRSTIFHYDVPYRIFYHSKGNNRLYVTLNGSRSNTVPEFKRWSWYPFIDGNVLNIADPMYERHEKLGLGWYWGFGEGEEGNFRKHIADIVEKVAEVTGSTEIVFYSSSGGCAPSIQAADYIGGCTVVSINPQLDLSKYGVNKSFKDIVGVDLDKEDVFSRNNVIPLISNGKNRHIIIENIRSNEDMVQYYELCDHLETTPGYGLKRKDKVILWGYDGPGIKPHNAQENYCIFFAIEHLINNFESETDLESLYLLFNEFWYNTLNEKKNHQLNEKNDEGIIGWGATHGEDKTFVVDMSSSEYRFNNVVLLNSLKLNTVYSIKIKSIEGNIEAATIGIKDIEQKGLHGKISVPVGKEYSIQFTTGSNPTGLSINAYPDEPGTSTGKSMKIEYTVDTFKREYMKI